MTKCRLPFIAVAVGLKSSAVDGWLSNLQGVGIKCLLSEVLIFAADETKREAETELPIIVIYDIKRSVFFVERFNALLYIHRSSLPFMI